MENVKVRYTLNSGSKFLGATFLYMFIDLLITAAVATGVGFLFTKVFPITDPSQVAVNQYFPIYIGLMIGSFFALFIIAIWFSISAARGRHSLAVPFVLYAVIFGILCSSFTMFISPVTIGLAFLITCLAFGSMALIGFFAKGNLSFLGIVAFGILCGAGLMALTNFIWMLILPEMFEPFYWVVEFAIFAVVMIITIIDVWNIKKTAELGEANNNLALFCAFNLYVDFINIFLRVLLLLVRIREN